MNKNDFVGNSVTFNFHKKYFVRKNSQFRDIYEKSDKSFYFRNDQKYNINNRDKKVRGNKRCTRCVCAQIVQELSLNIQIKFIDETVEQT